MPPCFLHTGDTAAEICPASRALSGRINTDGSIRVTHNTQQFVLGMQRSTADTQPLGLFRPPHLGLLGRRLVFGRRIRRRTIGLLCFPCLRLTLDVDLPSRELRGKTGILPLLADGK